jgi:hypothetical protein
MMMNKKEVQAYDYGSSKIEVDDFFSAFHELAYETRNEISS